MFFARRKHTQAGESKRTTTRRRCPGEDLTQHDSILEQSSADPTMCLEVAPPVVDIV
jgi:hypothetical protein